MLWSLFLLSLPSPLSSHAFYFVPNNRIGFEGNWLHKDKLCIDDKLVFEESENAVAFIDHNIMVSGMTLPQTGVVYLKDNVVIGRPGTQQCAKRKSPEDVFFEGNIGTWYHPMNWQYDHDPELSMNRVPGPADDVYFLPHSLQMYIEHPPRVASLNFSGRDSTKNDTNTC